jgi:hypothetical protein
VTAGARARPRPRIGSRRAAPAAGVERLPTETAVATGTRDTQRRTGERPTLEPSVRACVRACVRAYVRVCVRELDRFGRPTHDRGMRSADWRGSRDRACDK